MGRLDGKVAVVTGGSSGIGKSIALLYAKEGADVVIISRKEEALKEVCKLNEKKITYVVGDITQDEVVKKETIKLDAYKDVDTILKFINDSKRHSQSKYCKEHFNNILRTKSMDQKMRNLLRKNLIIEKKD